MGSVGAETLWNSYLILRLVIGILECIAEVFQSSRLFHYDEVLFGGLTLAFPFLSFIVATISLLIQRNLIKNLNCLKLFRLIFMHTTEIYAGYFQSGPELILQLTIIWKGLLKDDLHKFFSGEDYGSVAWCFGLNNVLSITMSFLSVLITSLHYNRQAEIPAAKFFSAALTTIFSICLRVFIISILFATVPGPAAGIVTVMYFIHLITYKASGGLEENWNCIIYSYYSIFTPSGYARWIGSAKSTKMNGSLGASEIERAKLNQDSLLKRVVVSYILYVSLSLALLVVYSTLVEVLLLSDDIAILEKIEMNKRIAILHTPPTTLLVLTIMFLGWHYEQIKRLRDGTRTWYTISMNGDPNRSSIIRQPAFNPSAPIDPPPPYQQQLLPHTPNLHNYPKVLPTIPNSPHSFNNVAFNESIHAESTRKTHEPTIPESHEPRPHGTYKLHEDGCVTCELFLEGTSFLSKTTGKNYLFSSGVSCTDKNCIYMVTCLNNNCGKQYVGKSTQEMRKRHYGHRREIEIKSSPLGKHFSDTCGYVYFQLQIIDQIHPQKGEDSEKLKQELQRREGYWQHELMTFEPWGLNTRDELNGAGIIIPQANTPRIKN